MDDSTIDRIFAGVLQDLPKVRHPLVRIYTSSTYTDMSLEKHVLVTEVYPRLKEYCREKHGLEFQIVDMRWGVRDEATDDHMTTSICLEEIRTCQQTSIGPNFIFFGGQKYGYRPIPNIIACEEFARIIKSLEDLGRDCSILNLWYDKDCNAVPAEMILQPISTILPNFLNKLVPSLHEQDQEAWWKCLCQMQELLREATGFMFKTDQITLEERRNYEMSVIEREVEMGILRATNTKATSLAFLRRIQNINMNDNKNAGEGRRPVHYLDMKNLKLDKEASKLITELREVKVPAKLDKANYRFYELDWSAIIGHSAEGFDQYITSFVRDFYKLVIKLIDRAMKSTDNNLRETIAKEVHKHLEMCVKETEKFMGRHEELNKIRSYILGDQRRALIIYGATGSGKTCFLAKIATKTDHWRRDKGTENVLIVRFLGTTPNTTSMDLALFSICQQLSYNLEIPMENVPEEFVPLKNYFHFLLDEAEKRKIFVLILLDALDIFFVNSYQNGASSWLPQELPANIKIIITLLRDPRGSQATEVDKFLDSFATADGANTLELGELGQGLAELILRESLGKISRTLTNHQWRVVFNALEKCSTPLFVTLCFAEIKHWKSYSLPEETRIPKSIELSISDLFEALEVKYGKVLVEHALGYISASKNGLSETELEDILCLDDSALEEVFVYHLPQVRRIPPILWTKIRRELQQHFTENEADGIRVLVWAHQQFRDVSAKRYLSNSEKKTYLHATMCEYFMGVWSEGREKPFRYTELQRQRLNIGCKYGKADRKVPLQPNVFMGNDSTVARYNLRKFSELPFHLIGAGNTEDLCHQILFNYLWLHAKISAGPIAKVLDDYSQALVFVKDALLNKQISIVFGALLLSRTILDKFPDMLAPHLLGRLLPDIKQHNHIRSLLQQCDEEGVKHNCLLPLRHCLDSPGGPLKYSLEGHQFAIFGCALTSDKRYVISISTRFISWDLSTSEVCRDIDPQSEGIMLGMAVSKDNRWAAAFTSSYQVILVDTMLGNFVRVERAMEHGDDIIDIAFTGEEAEKIVAYNNKYFRLFNKKGEHISGQAFPVGLTDVLFMKFFSSDKMFISVHWTGDQDLDDTRMWIRASYNGISAEPTLLQHSVQIISMEQGMLKYFTCRSSANQVGSPSKSPSRTSLMESSWDVIKRTQDQEGNVLKEEIILAKVEEVFSLKTQNYFLICAVAEGFVITDLKDLERGRKKLYLPRHIRNIRVRLNDSNPCVMDLTKTILVAGVRKDIFVWNLRTQDLIRSFQAHGGRILAMQIMQERQNNVIITSSLDKTVKVWDAAKMLDVVPFVEKMDQKVDKLILCELIDTVVVVTRGGLGFWNLTTGALESKAAECPAGGCIIDVVITANGKFFVTAEQDLVQIWNLPNRVVLYKDHQVDLMQLEMVEASEVTGIVVAVSCSEVQKEGEELFYRIVARSLQNGSKVYQMQCLVKNRQRVLLTKDNQYLCVLGWDKAKEKDSVFVYHSKKGTLLHKIPLKYKNFKRPVDFKIMDESNVVIVDAQKATQLDVRTRTFTLSCKKWTGQATSDAKLGLSAPNSGGLSILDLKAGKATQTLLQKSSEGIFSVLCCFTKCEKLVMYYHSKRRTLRLFRVDDGKMTANFCLSSEATAIQCTEDSKKIIIGCSDGSVTILVIADNSQDLLETSRMFLKSLISRQVSREEEMMMNRMRKDPIVRFRAIARTALHMDKVVKNWKASKRDPFKRKTCLVS